MKLTNKQIMELGNKTIEALKLKVQREFKIFKDGYLYNIDGCLDASMEDIFDDALKISLYTEVEDYFSESTLDRFDLKELTFFVSREEFISDVYDHFLNTDMFTFTNTNFLEDLLEDFARVGNVQIINNNN